MTSFSILACVRAHDPRIGDVVGIVRDFREGEALVEAHVIDGRPASEAERDVWISCDYLQPITKAELVVSLGVV